MHKNNYKIKTSTIGVWSIFLVLLFFAGFRWDVGIDWPAYMSIFSDYKMLLNFANGTSSMEIGQVGIGYLLKQNGLLDGGYHLWVAAFITLFFIFYSIWKYSVSPIFSAILFISFGIFFESLNGVRQYMAISLFVFSWRFILDKQWVRYLLIVYIASLFHTSALILFPFYFVGTIRFNPQFLILAAAVAVLLSPFISPHINQVLGSFDNYEEYASFTFTEGGVLSYLRVVFPLTLLLLINMVYDKMTSSRYRLILTNLAISSIFITFLSPTNQMAIRIGQYFAISFIFVIPILCNTLTKRNRQIIIAYITIYSTLFTYTTKLRNPITNLLPFELDFQLTNSSLMWVLCITFFCSIFIVWLLTLSCNKSFINKNE